MLAIYFKKYNSLAHKMASSKEDASASTTGGIPVFTDVLAAT